MFMRAPTVCSLLASLAGATLAQNAITADGTNFTLTADNASYLFHVDPESGDLVSDHFGGPADDFTPPPDIYQGGWVDGLSNTRREFPDVGRSDLRLPAIRIQHADGNTVTAFSYQSHEIVQGKPALPRLPATFGNDSDVSTLQVKLYDNYSDVAAMLSYSIFPKYNAVARSFQITNNGSADIVIERAAAFSIDFPNLDLNMIELQGDWSNEMHKVIRKVDYGETGFRSTQGYSSHLHNPFFALISPTTTETTGEAWGFNLIYTGSFAATAERFSHGFIRVLLGLNPLHSSITVAPGENFTSPEAVAVYSSEGLGGMSRSFHDLYRNHLSRSNYTFQTRPVLLNSWEALYHDINDTSLTSLATQANDLGIKLFVTDDGWFGTDYPRDNDTLGLGDWSVNPAKFPEGLAPVVEDINNLITTTNYTTSNGGPSNPLKFGLWVEPEMVNPNSTLYHEHPDWVLKSNQHIQTLTRNQLVLNVGLPEVQNFIITTISNIINSANIEYIKWDNNRAIHEMPHPSADHKYILGLYHIIDTLTTQHPQILWEGCASGGGRFDAGLLHYWPQHWTSDNTDASDRVGIQLGTSLIYPPSAMSCHVSIVPNHLTTRNISLTYRAHVALMCGSFGFELDPSKLPPEEKTAIPSIMAESDGINPLVLSGDFYRLRLPEESNWPAVQFTSKMGNEAVVFAFQQFAKIKPVAPPLKLQGLDPEARYWNNYDNATYSGKTYMNAGLNVHFEVGDYQSRLIWLYKQ